MDLFLADNHFGKHPAKTIHRELGNRFGLNFRFYEDDLNSFLENSPGSVDFLILHLIGDTSGVDHAGPEVEKWIFEYLQSQKPLLLMHGASAAFWKWDWWRRIVGLRWVRDNDPDGMPPSTHPVVSAPIVRTKSTHPLTGRLRNFEMPEDELYIDLAYVGPIWVLMAAPHGGESHPMLYECESPGGGQIMGWLPGHREETLRHSDFLHNTVEIIHYLKGDSRREEKAGAPPRRNPIQH